MPRLNPSLEARLTRFARALVDQERARIIVTPQENAPGYWFGGGNMIETAAGDLYLVGRYRNFGDSRTGLLAGERGLELAIFRCIDRGRAFEKVVRWTKADLSSDGREVLSIEGSALRVTANGVELFVSSEKAGIGYPEGFKDHLKPGCGVWTIDHLSGDSIETLDHAAPQPVLAGVDPAFLHVKDPFVASGPEEDLRLMFCTHPFCWSSSNTAFAIRRQGDACFQQPCIDFFPRGVTWDVAMTRATCVVAVPRRGVFQDQRVHLVYYDGGECVRNLDEHTRAVRRPRGYSCEELGGLAYFDGDDPRDIHRLSQNSPMFVSPYGTGCSRYVDVLATDDGFYATWQQSQANLSQPLVMHYLAREQAESLLFAP